MLGSPAPKQACSAPLVLWRFTTWIEKSQQNASLLPTNLIHMEKSRLKSYISLYKPSCLWAQSNWDLHSRSHCHQLFGQANCQRGSCWFPLRWSSTSPSAGQHSPFCRPRNVWSAASGGICRSQNQHWSWIFWSSRETRGPRIGPHWPQKKHRVLESRGCRRKSWTVLSRAKCTIYGEKESWVGYEGPAKLADLCTFNTSKFPLLWGLWWSLFVSKMCSNCVEQIVPKHD